MGTTARDLFIDFDRSRRRSLRVQVENGLREAIRSGRLRAGAAVPSTRALAADLEVTRKVIVEAYEQLVAEGYLVSRRGAGTVVNQAPQRRPRPRPCATGPAAVVVDFRPGRPDLDLFPRAAWARASRQALRTLPTRDFAYDDPRGLPALRGAIADYLARARGARTDPESVIVCAGFSHGFDLVLGALDARGHDRMAVEDPGYAAPRRQLAARGFRYDAIAVDRDGLRVDALRRTAARLVHVTPAHQSPTGVVLSAERRQQLIAWAREVDGYVIEDDYDAEYRYDRRPVGTLQGVAPDRVIYCGTTSKTLASGVRLGWLAVPPGLVDSIVAWRHLTDGSTSTILQATFAAFLSAGDLDRHLRRTRRIYRARRDAVITALRRWLPRATPSGVSAGQNVLVTLPAGADEQAVVKRALASGVRVYPLADYRPRPARSDNPGVVLGYGSVPADKVDRGVRLLARAVDEAGGKR
jgi:GntR family transcriptional regulator / MocR family aminotransferase